MLSSILQIHSVLFESSTAGDSKHSTGTLDDHDHDILMPRREPPSVRISSALTPGPSVIPPN